MEFLGIDDILWSFYLSVSLGTPASFVCCVPSILTSLHPSDPPSSFPFTSAQTVHALKPRVITTFPWFLFISSVWLWLYAGIFADHLLLSWPAQIQITLLWAPSKSSFRLSQDFAACLLICKAVSLKEELPVHNCTPGPWPSVQHMVDIQYILNIL